MDQILQLVLNNGGRRSQNGSNYPIGAEQWGVKRVGGAKMDQILQLVLNNGGVKKKEMDQILQLVFNI